MERDISYAKAGARARLTSLPDGWRPAAARSWLEEVGTTWRALAHYGAQRLDDEGWRRAGVGLVHEQIEGFRSLAEPVAVAWATLDMCDGWGQTVVDVALRQRHWFTPPARRVLAALASSCFDLYVVAECCAPSLVLRRVSDGERVPVHARLDRGAYPAGAHVVARLVDDGACVSLASAVVDPRELATDAFEERQDRSDALMRVVLSRLVRCANDSRTDVLEPRLAGLPPDSYRRLYRAFDAFSGALSRSSEGGYCYTEAAGRRLTADPDGIVEIDSRVARTTFCRLPSATCAAFDVELAVQAGAGLYPDHVVTADTANGQLGARKVDEAARLCARAALALIGERRAAA